MSAGVAGEPASGAVVAPVSVVVGGDDFLTERAVTRLVAAAGAAQGGGGAPGPSGGVRDVAAAALSPGELASLTAPSLFGDGPVVVVRDAQDASKEVAAELAALAADPPPDVVSVVTHAGGSKGRALLTALARSGAAVVECPPITRMADRMAFVRREFRAAGRSADDSGVRALLDALGTDLREIASACSQLASDTTGVIDQAVVARYYRGRADVSGFAVADRAVEGHLAEALESLRWALAVGVSPVQVTSALAQGVRLLGRVGAAPRGRGDAALAAAAGAPPWKIDKARQQFRGWTMEGIARAIAAIAAADAQVKGEGTSPGYALENAIREVVAARSAR